MPRTPGRSHPCTVKVLFHVKHPEDPSVLETNAAKLGVRLSAAQAASLLILETLLLERAVPGGMIAEADAPRLRERHVLDCLRAAAVVRPGDKDAYDLGSGAGLPGLVLAVALPDLRLTLVETRRRRAAFLELAVERLGLRNAAVAVSRIEALSERVDLCFARALAPATVGWRLAEPLLRPEGRLVHFAGAGAVGPFRVPGARVIETRSTPVLERAGPLVIMAR